MALLETHRSSATELFPRPSSSIHSTTRKFSFQMFMCDTKEGETSKPSLEMITWCERHVWFAGRARGNGTSTNPTLLTDPSTIDLVYEPLWASIIKAVWCWSFSPRHTELRKNHCEDYRCITYWLNLFFYIYIFYIYYFYYHVLSYIIMALLWLGQ